MKGLTKEGVLSRRTLLFNTGVKKKETRERRTVTQIYINRCVFKKSVRVEGGPVCRDAHGNILQDAVSGPEHTFSPYGLLES